MTSTFTGAGQASYVEQNGTFDSVYITIQAATAPTIAQLIAATLQVSLQRDGQQTNIISGPLYACALAGDPTQYEGSTILVNGVYYMGLKVDFFGCINLKEDDKLTITLNGSGLPSGSTTTICTDYCVGVEEYTPSVTIYTVDPLRASFDIPAIDFVNGITFLQNASPGADTVPLFTSVSINSDKWRAQYSLPTLLGLMANQWDTAPTRLAFFAYLGEELQKCNISYTINTGLSTAGFVIVHGGQKTPTVVRRARALITKIAHEQAATFNKTS